MAESSFWHIRLHLLNSFQISPQLPICICLYFSLQALLREKQKTEELEKAKEAIKQLIYDAAVRTKKEVHGY